MGRRRVLVTGMGFVTPHGDQADRIFERVYAGESAVGLYRSGRGAAEADVVLGKADWNPDTYVTPIQKLAMDPVAQMAYAAARHALAQAGLTGRADLLSSAGVYMGCGLGGAATYEQGYESYFTKNSRRQKPTIVPRVMPNAPAAHISMAFGIRGPSLTYSVACTSSAAALGEAYRAIRDGYLECVVAGGAEAMLAEAVVIAWESMGVIAKLHPDGPAASVRPFDAARTGFALAEGAAVLILESEERARERGAVPLGEIVGYGSSSDAHNLTQPSREGQAHAMRAALADAGVPPEAVGYINAHATATKVGDVVEVQAVKDTFGAQASRLAVSSTKSMHGHLVGAAGALELGLTLMAVARGRIPPTANLTQPDAECDLDFVPGRGREAPELEYALSNSFGFGGSNASLVVRRIVD
ncbi:MAG TPA: beta-ketoacyl-[acyl-carrier-protein] synthase family protein [Longimicrobiales bacterium]|nr:beta-ketoacyl-[acyl-carrier-protein] synthase family protein [Longimicrobiales bacterium]